MVIVTDFGLDVHSYAREFPRLTFPHPAQCPHCQVAGCIVGHGSYARNVVDPLQAIPIRVKRFRCRACRRTGALLPHFCLPWRHYVAGTIQAVLDLRIVGGASWAQLGRQFAPGDLPTLTTCREWVGTFARQSQAYVAGILHQLARWQTQPGRVELALESVARAAGGARQLVAAVPHLLAFVAEQGVEVAGGATHWLATLAGWGRAQRLGRLV